MKLLQGKTALVTGASKGIGRSIAIRYAEQGANVAFTYLSSVEQGQALEAELTAKGVKAKGFRSDASDFAQAEKLINDVIAEFGSAGKLIGGAGPDRLAAQLLVKLHQLARTFDHLRITRLGADPGIGEAHDAIIGPGRYCEARAMIQEILREVDMRLAAVEAGIDMSEGDRDQRAGAQNIGGGEHEPHGKLHRRTMGAIEMRQVRVIECDVAHAGTFSRAIRFKVT